MKKQRGWTLFELVWVLAALAVTAVGIAGICIAVHFIRKFW